MIYYVLWIQTTKYAHRRYRITTNQEKKNFPPNNPWFEGQYTSLEDLREDNPDISQCDKCGEQIDTETMTYLTLDSTTLCESCIQTIHVSKQL